MVKRVKKAAARPKKRKIAVRRAVKSAKKAKDSAAAITNKDEVLIGVVTHYFPHVKAGALIVKKGNLKIGDTVHIKGHTTDFKQKITSMQIDRVPTEKAARGEEMGILVKSRVRIHDKVFLVRA